MDGPLIEQMANDQIALEGALLSGTISPRCPEVTCLIVRPGTTGTFTLAHRGPMNETSSRLGSTHTFVLCNSPDLALKLGPVGADFAGMRIEML